MKVVILTCGDLGEEVAREIIAREPTIEVVVVYTPYRGPRRTLWQKVKRIYRMQGPTGFAKVVTEKLRKAWKQPHTMDGSSSESPTATAEFQDFHAPECLEFIRSWKPDLGVVAGTYILKPSVFSIPRLGCINIHSGKVPDYRGSAPAFWELFNGEREVGITIHQVSEKLDAGNVIVQESFPLDPAPEGDVMEYIENYRSSVLRPHSVRMAADATVAIVRGQANPQPQDHTRGTTYRSPTYSQTKELRRRVKQRRHGHS